MGLLIIKRPKNEIIFIINFNFNIIFISFKGNKKLLKIDVSAYEAIPNDGKNDADALGKAFEFAKINKGSTIYFPADVYDFRDEKAVQQMNEVMSGKMGNDPEKTIFTPYYPYSKGLDFNGFENITVDAYGATLLCDGWMEPVSIAKCKNITLKGLSIDYKRKPHSVGKITEVQTDYFEVDCDSIYPIIVSMAIPRMIFWG